MKNLLAATAAAALTLTAAPAFADDHMEGDMVELTTAQQTMYDGWPAERQTTYDAWPMEAKTYYWTLTPEQTEAWWVLTNEQRVRVVGMNEMQRSQAWTSILSQINGTAAAPAAPAAQANASATAATTGNVRFVSNEMAQSAPAPVTGEYPICSANQQDNCMNAWEAGRRGPGVNRPLDYWPGQPASEM
ncbi:hypothetical protein [Altererythrobacter sp. MTPC7]|uniref:hypothetical protein n=1 Tax=Altererythrobacter sp. MTPC7 TaxID=3056567 RepID=UPI0036F43736